MSYQFIDNDQDLVTFIDSIQSENWIALDTEFIREKTYYPNLCLVQIAAGEQLVCIDPLQIKDLSPLFALLADPTVTKVLHSAYQDLEIFYYLMESIPAPLFDTQVAASILGYGDQVGYGNLMQKVLNVTLEKSQSRTDWSRRPLSKAQLDYAIDDVRYLQKAYPILEKELKEQGRSDWVQADFEYLTNTKTYEPDVREVWRRIKGMVALNRQQLSVLRELGEWRESEAIRLNLPRRWVVSDDLMLGLAQNQPVNFEQVGAIKGARSKRLQRYYSQWLDCINTGQNIAEEDWPTLPKYQKLDASQKALITQLMLVVRYKAQEHNIASAAIASRKKIEKMVLSGSLVLSHDWRGALVNQTFDDVVSGNKSIYQEGEVIILE